MQSVSSWPPIWLTPMTEAEILDGEGEDIVDFAEAFGIITKDSVWQKSSESQS